MPNGEDIDEVSGFSEGGGPNVGVHSAGVVRSANEERLN